MSLAQERRDAATLEAEFEPFQVWTDARSRADGARHWHAGQPGWTPEQIISAWDARDMRDRLIVWQRKAATDGEALADGQGTEPGGCIDCEDGLVAVVGCSCGAPVSPAGPHEPRCGYEKCPRGCWNLLHPQVTADGGA